jgi:DNA-binding PadR family transcriptional regulator
MRAETLKGHLDGLLLSMLEPVGRGARSNGAFDLPTGTVYPALHRLERGGLVRGSWSDGPGRRRRVYELTAAGRAALTEQRVSWWQFAGAVSTVMGGGGGPAWTPAS